ncbi:hypothetical protein XELAEV_18015033mg [Xenopus laevis]|nr:hypothetical protein XELAEV_18015033mg [Xenopus laevis]
MILCIGDLQTKNQCQELCLGFNSSLESLLEKIINGYCHAAAIRCRQQEMGNDCDKKQTTKRDYAYPYIDCMAESCWAVICVLVLTVLTVACYLTELIIVQRQRKLGRRIHTTVQKKQSIYSSDDDSR